MLRQVAAVKTVHHKDLEEGFGEVYIPNALAKNIHASRSTGWRWVFPAKQTSVDPRSGKKMPSCTESVLQKAVKRAANRRASIKR